MKDHIDPNLVNITAEVSSTIFRLEHLTDLVRHKEMSETVKTMLLQLETPFTFVIVGEVKAGKSSFINALLESEEDICKVAPSPMTDTIQQILFGEEKTEVYVSPNVKKITAPYEILKEIAIVDTPGTNTIIAHHQEITENFIPYSDLIVFVFEAKNPYRQSAWDFFDYINLEWQRKIIFVLQQKDLMEPADLEINRQGVYDHALRKGITNPKVFCVSAKMEHSGDHENSGFLPLRNFISANITNGKAPYLKLQNVIITSEQIVHNITNSLGLRIRQYESDVIFRSEIKETLVHQELKTKNQVVQLVENLLATYDKITNHKYEELEKGLEFITVFKKAFTSIFGKDSGLKQWLSDHAKDFELQLNTSLKDKLQSGIMDVADNIQMMGKLVDSKIKTNTTILTNTDEIFADIAERRANVLRDLQQSFQQFMSKSENFYDDKMVNETSKMAPNLATGGGIAIVGIILAAAVQSSVFDITGGILTGIGVLFAGVTLGINRNRILKSFKKEILKGREIMEVQVSEKLNDYTSRIKSRIDSNFSEFDRLLADEKETLSAMALEKDKIIGDLDILKNKISSHL
jgi:GTPase SAR1 family protein